MGSTSPSRLDFSEVFRRHLAAKASMKEFYRRMRSGHTQGAMKLLGEEADLLRLCTIGLPKAAREGDLEIVTEVLKRLKCVESPEVEALYTNVLQIAAGKGHMDIVIKLFEEGADVNFRGGEYANALYAAVMGGNIDIVEWVIRKGADVNAEGGYHETALHAASKIGSREIVMRLLAEGAHADRQDVNGCYPLQLALREQHHEIANLLLPESTAFLASIKASDLRVCFGGGGHHIELYLDPIPAIRKVSREDFRRRGYPLFWGRILYDQVTLSRSQNSMVNDIKAKRIFLLANGTLLKLRKGTGYHCRLWERQDERGRGEQTQWVARQWTIDRKPRLAQHPTGDWFVECAFTTNSVALASSKTMLGPNSYSIPEIRDTLKTHGLRWIMAKVEATTTSEIFLEPRVFFTTSEYAQVPPRASTLLVPLVKELQSHWKKTLKSAQSHLSEMRMSLLKARGLNSDLIQALLKDSLLWDEIEQAFRKQVSELKEFRERHWKPIAPHERATERLLAEDTQDSEESDVNAFSAEVEKLQTFHEVELRALKETSQSLIQLEFNLTSIAEAQLSRSNNMSMKRLSWITFIFLPLMFVASVFGMNIDALASNPHWHWPVIIAIPTALVAFSVVFFLRWMEHRKPLIPDLEEGEQEGSHDRKMEGWASRLRMTWFSAGRRKRD